MKKLEEYEKLGIDIKDLDSVYIEDNVKIGRGCTIYPGVHLRGNTVIGDNTIIDSYSIIENSVIGDNNTIGPHAHIHTNSEIGNENIIGNYVEVKESVIGNNNRMKHLTYCGNATIGDYCNIGCGVVFSNFNYNSDRKHKEKTTLGNNIFIGSNVVLCAPLQIDDGSVVGAGSVITDNVPKDSLAIARPRQITKEDYFKKNIV